MTSIDIKEVFISRFPDGILMEADFSSLEVAVLAYLTQDPVLLEDIIQGRDMHKMRAAELFNKPETEVTKAERTLAKGFSFQLQYGSGAKNMSEKWNVDIKLCEKFIEQYYDRYAQVKAWQENCIYKVKKSRILTQERTEKGVRKGIGFLTSETGRRYVFTEYDAPEFLLKKGIEVSFSPTEIKNYPVQGLATGDIVPMVVGELYRKLLNHKDKCLLINTVHDSIMLDVKKEHVLFIYNLTKEVLDSVPQLMKKYFDMQWNVPLGSEFQIGTTWADMKPYKGELL